MDKTNDINDVIYNGNTALVMALMKKSKVNVRELLEHKKDVNGTFVEVINVNVKGRNSYTALPIEKIYNLTAESSCSL
jgi:hypothetical protein